MTQTNNSTSQPHQGSLLKRMLLGAAIGLCVIALFIFPGGEPNPSWGSLWMVRPLIVVPLAGAMGGLCNFFILHYHTQFGIHKIIAVIVSVFVFVVGLWLGIVLGLDGTMWN